MTTEPIPAPAILVERDTIAQVTELLGRLSRWLGTETKPTRACARALSLSETDDPITISLWAEDLAGRLCYLTHTSDIDPELSI